MAPLDTAERRQGGHGHFHMLIFILILLFLVCHTCHKNTYSDNCQLRKLYFNILSLWVNYWFTGLFTFPSWNETILVEFQASLMVNGEQNLRLRCGFSKYYHIGPNFSTLNINAISLQLMSWQT